MQALCWADIWSTLIAPARLEYPMGMGHGATAKQLDDSRRHKRWRDRRIKQVNTTTKELAQM
jgi:hypothetical protein